MTVQGKAKLEIIDDANEIMNNDSPAFKPFLRITFDNELTVDISTNLAEMIGGAGAGVRKRYGY